MEEMKNAYTILVGIPEGKRLLGRTGHGWEDNITIDLVEIGWEDMDMIYLAEERNHYYCKHSNKHSGSIKSRDLTIQVTVSCLKKDSYP